MGIFDKYKLGDVKVFETGRYFTEGDYLVRIENNKLIDGQKGESFIIEAEVLAVVSEEDEAPPVGTLAAQVCGIGGRSADKNAMGLSNMMQYLVVAVGAQKAEDLEESEWNEVADAAVTDNSFKETVLRLQCFNKPTKSGNVFTAHKWLRIATEKDYADFGLDK